MKTKYSDKDILTIIDHPCYCHPYCGPQCDKCYKMEQLHKYQINDLRRLFKAGWIRLATMSNGCSLEVVED